MKRYLTFLVGLGVFMFMISCNKNTSFDPQGGQLPSKYIFIRDTGTFDPQILNLTRGGSIIFVNNTSEAHHIKSDDGEILDVAIPVGMSVYVRPDTLVSAPLPVPYHCEIHTSQRGMINILP